MGSGGSASVSGGGHHPGDHRGNSSNNGVSHPLSSANPPGLPRPPLHPALSHSHGHSHNSHLMGGPGGSSHQHNGSPMQRLSHSALPHHGNHGPAPPPPTSHISNPPPSSYVKLVIRDEHNNNCRWRPRIWIPIQFN